MVDKKSESKAKLQPLPKLKPTSIEIQSTHTQEIIIALCGPIGSPLHKVRDMLKNLLSEKYSYECKVIKLSKYIEEITDECPHDGRFDRVKDLINKGNIARENYGNSILTDFAIRQITKDREDIKIDEGTDYYKPRRTCYIIDSIKNQEEFEALRSVYHEIVYFLGVFSPLPIREKELVNQGMKLNEVHELIDRDSGEEISHGQTVRETFPNSDFFLRVDSGSDDPLKLKLERFLKIIFDDDIITPSHGETAMYLASSAAGNSACLSRQVGASITDEDGEIISIGWNDVPKAGGNVYQYDQNNNSSSGTDHRCFKLDGGICSNDINKQNIIREIVLSLINEGIFDKDEDEKAVNIIKSSKIKDLLEFSRSIHAEMHAIILGGKASGNKLQKGKLYCTTYPCHSCARHIIASGISEVYYIEPYRKSLAIKLHGDAITEDENDLNKVKILPFEGVAPSRYLEIFKMKPNSRKDKKGHRITKSSKDASPINEVSLESIPALEAIVVNNLIKKKLIDV